jgi:anti-anti-sigma regulatory factor
VSQRTSSAIGTGLALPPRMTMYVRPLVLPPTLTAATRDTLRDDVLYHLEDPGIRQMGRLVLDGSAVTTVDAAGLGVLVLLEKRASEAGVVLVIEPVSAALRAMLVATALAGVFLSGNGHR